MLSGSTPLETLVPDAPEIRAFDIEPVALPDVEILQWSFEVAAGEVTELYPPALHPTLPPMAMIVAWSVPDSPWGAFELAQVRLSCRSGARPRGLLVGAVIDNAAAGGALAEHWGLRARVGRVAVERYYDAARVEVALDGDTILAVRGDDPDPLQPNDIQLFAAMHAARTPAGLRLVQFDPTWELTRAERYTPVLEAFDAGAWGQPRLEPNYPVVAFGAKANGVLPRLRFATRPDVNAFEGAETLVQGSDAAAAAATGEAS